jgi:fatty-acyl-CoA synthase
MPADTESLAARRGAERESRAAWLRALERTAPIARDGIVFPVLIDQLAVKFGAATALLNDRETVSYHVLAERAQRYAGWAMRQGVVAGDVVGLMLPNGPDYLAAWLGITRIGGIAALVNTRLVGASLAHCLAVAGPKHLIVGAEFAAPVAAVQPQLNPALQLWSHGADCRDMIPLEQALEPLEDRALLAESQPPSLSDTALYIYTSGTTGLPKAARITHQRIMQWALWFAGMLDTRPDDRMYNCLPMYHSIGGIVAIGAVLAGGGSVVLRPGFSASRFWDEIADWRCTLFQYIGELCRYLVNSPPHPSEAAHRLRLCVGNGLRADVWETFERRFRIPRIVEFYAATEGQVTLYNYAGRRGAIGHIPPFLRDRFAVELIPIDIESGEPWRDAQGRCRRCTAGETGEAISRIGAGRSFDGYTDAAAGARKILRDVFAQGDAWFRTGDLMRRDADGYFFFVDRVGDTYRWKGENVSTREVEQFVAACPGVLEAVVYGVEIPGADGRAGMAALQVAEDFDLAALRRHLGQHLPEFARPLLIRLVAAIDASSTHKPVKTALVRDGYDLALVADPIFLDDPVCHAFVPLDSALHARLRSGQLRL